MSNQTTAKQPSQPGAWMCPSCFGRDERDPSYAPYLVLDSHEDRCDVCGCRPPLVMIEAARAREVVGALFQLAHMFKEIADAANRLAFEQHQQRQMAGRLHPKCGCRHSKRCFLRAPPPAAVGMPSGWPGAPPPEPLCRYCARPMTGCLAPERHFLNALTEQKKWLVPRGDADYSALRQKQPFLDLHS